MDAEPAGAPITDDPMHAPTHEERRELFDQNARYYLGVTGDEFHRRWHAREYEDEIDVYISEAISSVAELLPLIEDEQPDSRRLAGLVNIARQVPNFHFLTAEEAWEMFDRRARERLFISGAEFQRRWFTGEFDGNDYWPNHLAIIDVYMLMPKHDLGSEQMETIMSATPQHDEEFTTEADEPVPSVVHMTDEEARTLFDENARYWLDMSGDEFIRKWRNREFGDVDNHPNHLRIMEVASLLPFVTNGPHER